MDFSTTSICSSIMYSLNIQVFKLLHPYNHQKEIAENIENNLQLWTMSPAVSVTGLLSVSVFLAVLAR